MKVNGKKKLENWKNALDEDVSICALFRDLSKDFDFNHNFFLAKMHDAF